MANLLNTGAAWLTLRLQQHASIAVVLQRESGAPIPLTATPGQTQFESQEYESGSVVRIESRDWIIAVAELDDHGQTYFPQAGDKLLVESLAAEFEVFAPDGGSVWRYSSAAENAIRVHSRRM